MRMTHTSMPTRPVLPPLFFCAIGLWVALAAAYVPLQAASLHVCVFLFVGALFMSLVVCVLLVRKGVCNVSLFALGAFLGVACAGQAAYVLHINMQRVDQAGLDDYVFQIIEEVQTSDFGAYSLARAINASGQSFLVRINLPQESNAHCWDTFQTTCTIKMPTYNAASYYWKKACVGSVSPYKPELQRPKGLLGFISQLRSQALSSYKTDPSDGALLLQSISFGDRSELFASQLYHTVRQCGLAHLVAVSGAHLSITAACIAFLLQLLRAPRRFSVCVQVLFCVFYVLFTGASHSALRACMMLACALFAFFGKRSSLSLNALSVCIITFLILQPRLCFSISLLLSALATCGIILFSGFCTAWVLAWTAGRFEKIASILGMTLAAIFSTLPFTCAQFGQLSLIAPLANLAATPVFGILCVGGMFAALPSLVFPKFIICTQLMLEVSQWFCAVLGFLARIPYAATAVSVPLWASTAFGLACAVLILRFWPHPSKRKSLNFLAVLAGLLVSLFVVFPHMHSDEIVMLDVGQGDAFILRSAHHGILIDTGNNDTSILQGLARHDVHYLDAVLITHPDADHCASLASVLSFVEVNRVLVARDLLECPCSNCKSLRSAAASCEVVGLSKGDSFSWGNFHAQVLSPETFKDEGGNVDSLVLHVTLDNDHDNTVDASALFCGDAESEVLASLEAAGELPAVDVYKVGHHGSAGACTPEQLRTLNPKIALISAGAHNRYGHPTEEVLDMLDEAAVAIYRTDLRGDVVCKFKATAVNVE